MLAGTALVRDNEMRQMRSQEVFQPNPHFPPIVPDGARSLQKEGLPKKELGTRTGLPRRKVKYLRKLEMKEIKRSNPEIFLGLAMWRGWMEVTFRNDAKNSPAFW